MTSRFWILSLAFYSLIFLGLVSLEGGLLILAIPLLIYLGAAIFFSPEDYQLKAIRTISTDNVSEGKPVIIKLVVTNEGPTLEEVLFEDIVPDGLSVINGKAIKRIMLPQNATVELEYTIQGPRGKYQFQGVQVTASDYFSLFQSQKKYEVPGNLLIFPSAMKLRQFPIYPRQTRGFAGPILARRGGSGVEFFGVREYQTGDSPRRINWRVSTRHFQDLFTNEFEQESIADVGIILDSRLQTNMVGGHSDLFEYSVMATSALAETMLAQGHRVSLLVYGYGMGRVFPGYGKVQQKRIMQMLAQAKPGENYALQSLQYLPTRLFPARSQLIFVSPLREKDLDTLVTLRAQGYEVLIVSPDPLHFESKLAAGASEYAKRLAHIERGLLIAKLRRAGVYVVDWNVEQALDKALHTVTVRSPRGRFALGVFQ
jgi:uncharacterized protein (DUF58 family)